MRALIRFALTGALLLAAWAAPAPLALATNVDTLPDHVLGQPGYVTNDQNHGGLKFGMNGPVNALVDPLSGRLYVSDNGNNRVLGWFNAQAFANGQAADLVLGQPSLLTNTINFGGLSPASLWQPSGLTVDGQGNLFVADTGNNRVLKYTVPFTTHASASVVLGQPNFVSGASYPTATLQTLHNPAGLALDHNGELYVADAGNNRLLIFNDLSMGAAALQFIGQTSPFSNTVNAGGPVGPASLWTPEALAFDSQHNLYVADSGNNRVLEFDAPSANDFTADRVFGQAGLAANGLNAGGLNAGALYDPSGVAVDGSGNVYVADYGNNRVLEFNAPIGATNTAALVFGQTNMTSNGGSLSAQGLEQPSAVALDSAHNLYITDFSNNRVLKFDLPVPYGLPSLALISPSTVAAGSPAFKLTATGSDFVPGSVVRWNGSSRPTTFLSSTQIQASIAATDLAGNGPFAVTVFTPSPGGGTSTLLNLTLYARASQDTTADVELGQPSFSESSYPNPALPGAANFISDGLWLAVDQNSGRLFVSDYNTYRVLSWPSVAALVNGQAADLVIGQPDPAAFTAPLAGPTANNLSGPRGVAVDGHGNLYVADEIANRVLEYSAPLSNGMAAHLVFGQGGSFTTGATNNGGRTANSLKEPNDLALDALGNLYVGDEFNQRVLEYDTPLTTDTTADRVFGEPDFNTDDSNDAGLTAATLGKMAGLALGPTGSLFVADYNNGRVLGYLDPLGSDALADVVIGQPSFITNTAGFGGATRSTLGSVRGLAVDGQGNLFASDANHNRVLEFDAPLSNFPLASRVFGQTSYTAGLPNGGSITPTRSGLASPYGLALDSHGNLLVADASNQRVLEFDRPLPPIKLFLALVRR